MSGTIRAETLKRFVASLFEAQGLAPPDALTVADSLVEANLRGVDTHGVFRAPVYLERLRRGLVAPRPEIQVEPRGPSAVLVDAANALGAIAGTRAITEAIGLARATGVGLAAVRHSNHYGMAAYYVLQAIEAGLIGLAFTNASPALPPWGGMRPFFGTSPLAAGIPGGARGPYLLDMAMAVLARGNVYVAAQRGERIPEGLALDAEGRPTTDPADVLAGGTMLPFGGLKGAALSMLMDILGGVLTGSAFAGRVANPHLELGRPGDVGHLFLCIDPGMFMQPADFAARMDELIERVKAEPRAAGIEEILIPGEREARMKERRLRDGVPLPAEVLASLDEEAEAAGVGAVSHLG